MSPNAIDATIVVGLAAFVVLLVLGRRWRRLSAMRDVLRDAGSTDARITGWSSACGTIRGALHEIALDAVEVGAPQGRTTIRAPIPEGAPRCEMRVHPAGEEDAHLLAHGLEIDVATGDADFDARIVVEAAPADVVRAVLDEPLRREMLALQPCSLVVSGAVRCEKLGAVIGRDDLERMVKLTSRLRARLSAAAAELEARRVEALAHEGAVEYRGVSEEALAEARRARDEKANAELAALRSLEDRRSSPAPLTVGGLIVVLVISAAILAFLFSGATCSG